MKCFVDKIFANNNYKPYNEALIYEDKRYTYQELEELIGKMAYFIKGKGINKGDRVLLICQNSPEFIISYLGIIRAGATVIPLNITLTPEEIKYIIKDAQAKLVVVHDKIVKAVASKLKLDLSKHVNIDLAVINNDFIDSIKDSPSADNEERAEIASFLYTSGTTGYPKGAMLTHNNLISNVKSLQEIGNLTEKDNMLCVLPMFHSFAWTTSVILPLYAGSKVTIQSTFKPREIVDIIAKEKATIFCGAPAMYTMLIQLGSMQAFKTLRFVVSGGSSLPEKILTSFEEKFEVPLVEGYGLSEASPVVTMNPIEGIRKPGSIGLPLPGVDVKLVDEDLKEVRVGEIGEIAVKGPNVMKGYFNMPEETENTMFDNWLLTGDMGKRDEDNYYYIIDRKKELIVVSGFNVYPKEVESAIYSYPDVKECAVIGAPDESRGEIVKALIVSDDNKEINIKDVKKHLKERLAPYKRPRVIELTDELPKNATGKIMKRLLK